MKELKRNYRRWTSTFLAVLLMVSTFLPSGMIDSAKAAQADHVVISQVYGGGGNSGAVFTNDFVELYNPTSVEISLDGWSVQKASSTGTSWQKINLTGSIKPYGYFLIQGKAGTSVTNKPLPTYDVNDSSFDMGGTSGKVALVNNTTVLSGKLPQDLIDFVGYGTGADFEGSGPTPAVGNATSAQRRPYANVAPGLNKGNAWDTDDNAKDFVSATPVPKNSDNTEIPMEPTISLDPKGNKIQFLQNGTSVKVSGEAGAAVAQSTINVYESVNKLTLLGTITATNDGSFEINVTSAPTLASVYVTATQGDLDESAGIQVNLAVPSTGVAVAKLSYMVNNDGVGSLIGDPTAAVANSSIMVYPNETANPAERLATKTSGVDGDFSFTINNAPNTIYVTQITNSSKGIMLESLPVAIEKADLSQVTPINVVKVTDSKGLLTNINDFFTVEGVVTVENGVMGSQKNNFYIQDDTGGINIFGSFDSGLTFERGDKLKVTGKLIQYNGLSEFEPTAIVKISEGNALPVAKDITLLDLNTFTAAEPNEGSLVKTSGKVTAVATSGSNYNITLKDENGKSTTIRVMSKTGITPDTVFVEGNSYSITGIVGQYTTNATHVSGYQVFPRDIADITPELNLNHTPLTQAYENTNIEFAAAASGADSVTLNYRVVGGDYIELPMTATSAGRYTAVLTAMNVPVNSFEYYIEAKSGDKSLTSGTSATPHTVILVPDTFGPNFLSETPQDGVRVESPRPEISVLMEDPSGIDATSVQVFFDGEEIDYSKALINTKQVKFTPIEDLEIKIHTVKVIATDLKGNTGEKEWTFESVPRFTGGEHYRGTTHNHTNISHDGAGTPQDAVNAGKEYGYDWFAFSDHSHDIDPTLLGTDTVERDGMQERTGGEDWQLTKDLAAEHTVNGEYVVFPAFEMTSTSWGHSNIFGTENFIDRNINGKMYNTDVNKYYAWVMTYDNIVGQFNHPDMGNNTFNNFKPYNKEADKLFTMLELGNGSGHYAYANAEKKYFSTLDLGWHLAPTYGEDNHEGTWGQTRARTVIVADDLSQESLLHSMRNMRVYMVEDPNFTLDVLANGYYMGSTVDSKELNFKISGSDLVAESRTMAEYNYLATDYKSDDRVEKVELISNGGVVVDSYSPMTKNFTWEPSYDVAGGQQWFVVRVTQMDGEKMYSAPIWSKEEAVDVKVDGIDIDGEVIIEGNPATLKANISNKGTQEVRSIKVDLYYDEVNDEHKIGTQTLTSIVSKGVGTATFNWTSPIKGDHHLIAVVTSLDGLDLGDTEYKLAVNVKEPLGIKVMIDAKHRNENTSTDGGSYANNLKDFTKMLQKEGYTVVENKETITDAVLTNVKVLVITHNRDPFTTEERATVAKFVQNGGSVLMAGKSNHSTNSTINNGLLSEIGTAIRIGDDGVFDDSESGNFWSDPTVSPFAVRVFPGLVDNYITDRVSFLDYYSGVSLAGANNQPLTETGNVTILAKGNETTYQGNIEGGYTYDNLSNTTGGSAIPLIASEEIGENGRIIVSGMNIFNDKQMNESFEPKGNDEFSLNAINWLAHRETTITKIGDARKLAEDTHTVIEGTVVTGAGVFFDAFYVQDETGGIMAFQEVPAGSIEPGDKVRIYGHIITFDNNKEIEFAKFDQDVIKIGSGDLIQPKQVATGEATSSTNQGLLVKVKGTILSKFDDNSYVINDGSGDVLVFTDGYIVNQSGPVPVLRIGDTLEAVGLSGEFAQGKRIRVRDTRELIGTPDETAPAAPTVAPVNDSDVVIAGTAEPRAKLVAKVGGQTIGEATANQAGHYQITISVQSVGTVIEVSATDLAGNESTATEVTVTKAPVVVQPPVTPPVDPTPGDDLPGKVEIDDKTGATTIVVDGTGLAKIIADSKESIDFDLTKLFTGSKNVSTNVDGELLKTIVESKKDLVINTGKEKVVLPAEVLADLASTTGNISFVINKTAASEKNAVSEVLDLTIYVEKDGKQTAYSIFSKPVKVSLSLEGKTITDKRKVAAYYLNEKTGVWEYVGGKWSGDSFTFTTNHFSKYAIFENSKTFKDVRTLWAKDEIEVLASRGIIKGQGPDLFAPNKDLTRAQFALLLARALNLPTGKYEGKFKDLQETDVWAVYEVEAAFRAGIITGRPDGTFGPNDKITREQMAAMIVRAIEYMDKSLLTNVKPVEAFGDEAKITQYAKDYVQKAAGLGILQGRPDKSFGPKENTSRAQAAVVIYRLLSALKVIE